MKLETKHILAYLGTKVHALLDGLSCEVEGIDLYQPDTLIAERTSYKLEKSKLILRPFNEWNTIEEITDEMTPSEINMIDDNPDLIFRLSYEVIQLMIKHHIDIFFLIPGGAAVEYGSKEILY